MYDLEDMKQRLAQAALELQAQEMEAKRIQADFLKKANEVGREILRLMDKGPELTPAEAQRLLRLLGLRMLLQNDPNVKDFAKAVPQLLELFAAGQKTQQPEPTTFEVEPE